VNVVKKELINYCHSIHIECVGIAHPGPYQELEEKLNNRIQNNQYTGMEEPDVKKRIDPKLTLNDAKSIIVCLFPYFTGHRQESNLSKYAYSKDYHKIVMNKLEKICDFLKERIENFHYKAYVDNGPLVDRHLAYIAGLGFYGQNNMLINPIYGSYVFIGYIINNYGFEYDSPIGKSCADCKMCIKKCPGNAFLDNYGMNPLRCISYITQKKGPLTEEEMRIMLAGEGKVFGCDICQDVCPHNKDVKITPIREFYEDHIYNVDRNELENMSNREFKRRYGDRAFSWRGKNVILRNFEVLNRK